MSLFLAPVPIIHVQTMLDAVKQGHQRFAFGSNAFDFFDKKIAEVSDQQTMDAFIYISKSGAYDLAGSNLQLGIFIQASLLGWVRADSRGQYPKGGAAYRPLSALEDGPMTLFWEIDNVHQLDQRKGMSEFISLTTRKHYTNDYVPQGPLLVERI